MSVIDEYLQNIAEPQKAELSRVRRIITTTVPEAKEVITYGMPGFKYKGKYLISFSAFKDHMSIFPGSHAIEVLQSKLSAYKTSKGTIQFTLENPISEELIREIVLIRIKDIDRA